MSSSVALQHPAAQREIGIDVVSLGRRGQRRYWRLVSMLATIVLPAALIAAYLYGYAADQYVTEFRFNIRHQAPLRMDASAGPPNAASLAGGVNGVPLAVITDSQIVVQYLKSRQIIDDMIAAGVDLDAIYAGSDHDFLAHLRSGASVEERQRYWRRMVDPFFDLSTGIVSVEVRAFRPADAQLVAGKALALAEKLINDMSERAHADLLSYATREVAESETKLKSVQAAIAAYRNQHAVLFPEMQATADSTVEGRVQESLIEAKTAYSAQLAQGASRDAMQMTMLRNRIDALETELRGVHGRLAMADPGGLAAGSLASVMSGYN
ncbi:MAG: hypothetical protein P4L90_19040, partial [Rhodopila sp.]|nr:hypothetical protein [Rhodopila sp.]